MQDNAGILFLASNPKGTDDLDLYTEVEAIKSAIRDGPHRQFFHIQQEWKVGLRDLPRLLLEYKPKVVHFAGHGRSDGELLFEDSVGNAEHADVDIVTAFVAHTDGATRIVVLNACFTKAQAESLIPVVDCVVGTPVALRNELAVAFSQGFYTALGFNRSAKDAYQLGIDTARLELESLKRQSGMARSDDEPAEQGIPLLLSKDGVDPTTLFILDHPPKEAKNDFLSYFDGRIGILKAFCATIGLMGSIIPGYAYFSNFAPPNFRELTLLTGGLALVALVATFMLKNVQRMLRKSVARIFAGFICLIVYGAMLDFTTVDAPPAYQSDTRFQVGFGLAEWSLTSEALATVESQNLETKELVMLSIQGYTDPDAVRLAWKWWSILLAQTILIVLFTIGFLLWTHGFALLAMSVK